MLSTAVRDLVARTLPQITDQRHPLRQALEAAPAEAVPLLLELLANEDRLHVRRGIVSLLAALAREHVPLLAEHLSDPRWFVARNVVTTLGEMRNPALIPYFKAALQYNDLRVRKEALAALAGLGTAEALAALAEALRHPDAETRAAAAAGARYPPTVVPRQSDEQSQPRTPDPRIHRVPPTETRAAAGWPGATTGGHSGHSHHRLTARANASPGDVPASAGASAIVRRFCAVCRA
jgi:HEAT repeat protein